MNDNGEFTLNDGVSSLSLSLCVHFFSRGIQSLVVAECEYARVCEN